MDCPEPRVVVIEDADSPAGIGAPVRIRMAVAGCAADGTTVAAVCANPEPSVKKIESAKGTNACHRARSNFVGCSGGTRGIVPVLRGFLELAKGTNACPRLKEISLVKHQDLISKRSL